MFIFPRFYEVGGQSLEKHWSKIKIQRVSNGHEEFRDVPKIQGTHIRKIILHENENIYVIKL